MYCVIHENILLLISVNKLGIETISDVSSILCNQMPNFMILISIGNQNSHLLIKYMEYTIKEYLLQVINNTKHMFVYFFVKKKTKDDLALSVCERSIKKSIHFEVFDRAKQMMHKMIADNGSLLLVSVCKKGSIKKIIEKYHDAFDIYYNSINKTYSILLMASRDFNMFVIKSLESKLLYAIHLNIAEQNQENASLINTSNEIGCGLFSKLNDERSIVDDRNTIHVYKAHNTKNLASLISDAHCILM